MVAVVLHLIFAQVTLVLLVCALVIGRISRWRPLWLAVPAVGAAVWTAAIGLPRAAAGFVAGPGQVAAYLAGTPGHPARLGRLQAAFSGAGHWLPRQLPLALAAAAAEAAVLAWLAWPGRRELGRCRPGLVIAIRRHLTAAALAAGGVVTRDGCGLGLDPASGRLAELSWAEAAGGVLMTGADPRMAGRASFPVACAAVRRRKTVIVVDLTGNRWLAEALSAVCESAGAPLARFGPAGPGCYEPFRDHPPARAASLVASLVDWSGVTEQEQRAGRRQLAEALAVLAPGPARDGGPAQGRPGHASVLDGLVDLLEPAPLRDQLGRLRASAPGRWLQAPAGPAREISIGQAVGERGGVLFSLDRGSQPEAAAMIARLTVADLTAVLQDLGELGLRGDGLVWIQGCEAVPRPALAELLALGPATGTAVLLSTSSPAAAASLAGVARVVVTGGPADPGLASRLAELTQFRRADGHQDVADLLRWQDEDEFAVIGRGAQPRFQPACRLGSAPWARLR